MIEKHHIENANIKSIVKDSMAPSGKSYMGFIKINGERAKIWIDSESYGLVWSELVRPQKSEPVKNIDFLAPIA